ncbi:MAG: hypothetical protein Q7R50_02945 [Dehalococcoidales bacterium]|nr:hypothetical protein [Dehalococcoidales bacterium]
MMIARVSLLLLGVSCTLGSSLVSANSISSTDATFWQEEQTPIVQNISGFYLARQYARFNRLDEGPTGKKIADEYTLRNRLRLRTDFLFNRSLSGAISMDTEFNYGVNGGRTELEGRYARLWDAYVNVEGDRMNLRLGRQTIRWGKADQVNVIDNFTPQDLREFLNLSREDRKWPVWAVKSTYYLSDRHVLEAIWIPVFEPSPVAGSEDDWEFFIRRNYVKAVGLRLLQDRLPSHKLRNGVLASRLAYSGQDFDASVSYAYHFDEIPSYNANLSNGTVQAEFPRQHSIGMDFETTREGLGFRGEAVYTTNRAYATFDRTVSGLIARKPTLQTVIGADYTFKSQTYLNLQLTQDYIFHYEELMQPLRYKKSVVTLIRQPFFHDQWELEFQSRFFLSEVDSFYRIQLRYDFLDDLRLTFGIMIFRGNDYALFGQYRHNNQGFFNLRYDFQH